MEEGHLTSFCYDEESRSLVAVRDWSLKLLVLPRRFRVSLLCAASNRCHLRDHHAKEIAGASLPLQNAAEKVDTKVASWSVIIIVQYRQRREK